MPARRFWNYRMQRGNYMANTLKAIVAKLNDTMRATLEGAAGLCLARTHYDVEIEHFLTKLLDASGTDFAGILQHFGVDKSRLAGELDAQPRQAEDRQRAHSGVQPVAAPHAARSLDGRLAGIRRGPGPLRHRHPGAGVRRRAVAAGPRRQQGVPQDRARGAAQGAARDPGGFARVRRGGRTRLRPAAGRSPGAAKAGGKTPNLDQFTVNLTENAQARERSIPCWAAISRSARWWTFSRGAGRTTPS